MKNLIETLKSSPIFNLSLTSKELFHSNFIAWLISEYPVEMWSVFSKYTSLESEKYKIKEDSIDREQKHIDIMFDVVEVGKDDNKFIKIIIENKVKSLPYLDQLEEYSKKFPNACSILLSLSKPNHLLNNNLKVQIGEKEWYLFTYEQLADALSRIDFGLIPTKNNEYHKMLIYDYICFVKNLVEINKITEIHDNEIFNWYGNVFKDLDNIRLGDFYVKKKCENMINLIFDEIKNMNIGNVNSMSISSSIVHSTDGEFRFYYSFNERTYVSVEISRMYYRKLVYVSNEKKEGKALHNYKVVFDSENDVVPFFNELNWFNFDKIPDSKKDTTYKSYKNFNSFGNAKYCQCRLNENNTVNEIINYFKEDLTFIISKSDLINQKFTI